MACDSLKSIKGAISPKPTHREDRIIFAIKILLISEKNKAQSDHKTVKPMTFPKAL